MQSPNAEILWFGQPLLLSFDPATAVQLYAARQATAEKGRVATYRLSVLALALALPSDAYKPWSAAEKAACEATRKARARVEAYIRLLPVPTPQDRADLVAAQTAEREAITAFTAAEVVDVPVAAADVFATGQRVEAALLAAKMPPLQVAMLAGQASALAESIAVGGWEEWQQLEAAGFSMAPAVTSSSGACDVHPDGKVEHPAGSS